MAGTERSGRRRLEPTTVDLPRVGDDEDSIIGYLRAVVEAVGNGRMDARIGDTCISGANCALRALKQRHARGEMLDLQRMLDEAKATVRTGLAREVAERQRSNAAP